MTNAQFWRDVGKHLAAERRRRGWSLSEVGRHGGLAYNIVQTQERGQIDYEAPDTVAVSQRRAFAEERLLAIREELIVEGYKNFRLNLNGPSPGTGLVRHYGAARIINGSLDWVTP